MEDSGYAPFIQFCARTMGDFYRELQNIAPTNLSIREIQITSQSFHGVEDLLTPLQSFKPPYPYDIIFLEDYKKPTDVGMAPSYFPIPSWTSVRSSVPRPERLEDIRREQRTLYSQAMKLAEEQPLLLYYRSDILKVSETHAWDLLVSKGVLGGGEAGSLHKTKQSRHERRTPLIMSSFDFLPSFMSAWFCFVWALCLPPPNTPFSTPSS
jgi:hypothetical protein